MREINSKGIMVFMVLMVCIVLGGCTNSSTHGTEKDIKTTNTFNVSGNSTVYIKAPLSLDSTAETAQDTANTATTSPTTRMQLTEGGSTAAGEASSLSDVASTLRQKMQSDNKTETKSETNSQTVPTPAAPQVNTPSSTGGSSTGGDNGSTSTQAPTVINGTTGASAAILWKPVADSGGMLVVLLPNAMGNPAVSVLDMQGQVIEAGKFVYFSNPNRATYRFTRSGAKFPSPCLLKVGGTMYLVNDAAKRNESLPSYTMTATGTTSVSGYNNSATYDSYGVRNGGRQAWRVNKKGPEFGGKIKIAFSSGKTFTINDTSKNCRDREDTCQRDSNAPMYGFVFKPGIGPNGDGDADTGTSHGGVYLHAPYGDSSKQATFYF